MGLIDQVTFLSGPQEPAEDHVLRGSSTVMRDFFQAKERRNQGGGAHQVVSGGEIHHKLARKNGIELRKTIWKTMENHGINTIVNQTWDWT